MLSAPSLATASSSENPQHEYSVGVKTVVAILEWIKDSGYKFKSVDKQ